MPKMFTIPDVKKAIEIEGLSYTVMYYLSPEHILDEKLKQMFTKANKILRDIEVYVEEMTEEEMDYG